MAIFDRLMFWKKKDELGIPRGGRDLGLPVDDLGMQQQYGQYPQQGFAPQQGFQQPMMESFQNQQNFRQDRDTELISAKLDAIKAMLENLNQRVANLERIAKGEQEDLNSINPRRKW